MLEKIRQIFQIKDLRNSLLFVMGMLIVFRIAAHIPVPGANIENLRNFFSQNEMLGMLNILSGGAMKNFSIVAMGVAPYITASIIMQLLTMVIPRLEELSKEGSSGTAKINQYSRLLTVPLALLQSYGLIMLFRQSAQPIIGGLSTFELINILMVMSAGTIFLMWIGELITEKRIGNGISLIIFAGIVEGIPIALQQSIVTFSKAQAMNWLVLGGLALITIAGVVIITEGQRNIPVTYARRIRGNRMYGGTDTYLPFRVNQAGMIPIIFAISIVLFPGLVGQLMVRSASSFVAGFGNILLQINQNQLIYGLLYFTLVVAFTYFYTSIIFHPNQIADNLQKQGGFVPGIRPGQPTARFLKNVSNRIMPAGALSLGVIAILPIITQNVFRVTTFVVGGAAILIVVSVVLESVKQIQAQIAMHEYEGV
ncbi:preprotein translocase subunit SecY [Patescibacteria group bacterium AH-259-L05]|nr:preprotein translocase subunit SecY [Patescibacteria group bacterium AH-259-L05]